MSRFYCMHKILVHAQHSCACTTLLCMYWAREPRGQGPSQGPGAGPGTQKGSGPKPGTGPAAFLGPMPGPWPLAWSLAPGFPGPDGPWPLGSRPIFARQKHDIRRKLMSVRRTKYVGYATICVDEAKNYAG